VERAPTLLSICKCLLPCCYLAAAPLFPLVLLPTFWRRASSMVLECSCHHTDRWL